MKTVHVRAKHLKEGDRIVYKGVFSDFTMYVDDVQFTRDGEVKVSIGIGGTGTEWYEMDELVHVLVD